MTDIASITKENGFLVIKTPYHSQFIKDIRLIPSAKWKPRKGWVVPAKYEASARKIVEKYFPRKPITRLVLVDVITSSKKFAVDGRWIMSFGWDYAKVYNVKGVDIIASDVEGGGHAGEPSIWSGRILFRHMGGETASYCCNISSMLNVKGAGALDPEVALWIRDSVFLKERPEDGRLIDEPTCKQVCDKLKEMGYAVNKCDFVEDETAHCKIETGEKKAEATPLSRMEIIS